MWPKCLSIAGFDGSGGAGLQADLKTFSALGCYGMTVLTALPVQNTQGVTACYEIPLQAIQDQLETLFEDIRPDSIKIGMLFQAEIVELVSDFLEQHAKDIPIVLDPVMIAKSGDALLLPNAIDALKYRLMPLVTIVTPNRPEAEALTHLTGPTEIQAETLLALGAKAVLLKGGHGEETHSKDLYRDNTGEHRWFEHPRIKSQNTHGTGCTLSAAIAAYLAQGHLLPEACGLAKDYVWHAIQAAKNGSVGHGHGPVHHFHALW